jgi:hypothetical protein
MEEVLGVGMTIVLSPLVIKQKLTACEKECYTHIWGNPAYKKTENTALRKNKSTRCLEGRVGRKMEEMSLEDQPGQGYMRLWSQVYTWKPW